MLESIRSLVLNTYQYNQLMIDVVYIRIQFAEYGNVYLGILDEIVNSSKERFVDQYDGGLSSGVLEVVAIEKIVNQHLV